MIKFKRLLMLLILIMAFSIPQTALAKDFVDASPADWFYNDLQTMVNRGVVAGYQDGSFKPQNSITVGEFLKMLAINSGAPNMAAAPGEHWAQPYHDYAVTTGWLFGEIADLNAKADRFLVAELVLLALNLDIDTNTVSPFSDIDSPLLNTLYQKGIINGSDSEQGLVYRPMQAISRAEICAILNRSYQWQLANNPQQVEPTPAPEPPPTPAPADDGDFSYPLITAAMPEQPQLSYDYFKQVMLHMMVNNIDYIELTFAGYSYQQLEDAGIYDDLVFAAHSQIFDQYHELAAFYQSIEVGLTPNRGSTIVSIDISHPVYTNQQVIERKNMMIAELEDWVNQLFDQGIIYEGMSDYDMAYTFYQLIITEFAYDTNYLPASFDGYGMLENGIGVCQAYVSLFNAMCKIVGIEVQGAGGLADGEAHIWSYVNLDGEWTYVDPTWGDPVPDMVDYFDPYYFDISKQELSGSHIFTAYY